MPEIPEIEGVLAFLRPRIVGQRVADIQVAAISAIKTADPPIFAVRGTTVVDLQRRGKFLVIDLVDGDGQPLHLATHLSRAGWLKWLDSPALRPVALGRGPLAARLTFVSDDGEISGGFDLTEAGTQKRLAIYLVRDLVDVPGIARLGPDPMDPQFTRESFEAVLAAAGKRHLKTLLRDQSMLAGVGNAYSDELLHAAKLSPATAADSLTRAERTTLYDAMIEVLTAAIETARRLPPAQLKDGKRSGMRVHGRGGKPCPVCGDTIRSVSTADTEWQYCPTCQTGGTPLADRRLSRLLK
jgi:formamidopyrimidine-DNA glycosylase